MFSVHKAARSVVFALAMGMASLSCNVDPVWPQRQVTGPEVGESSSRRLVSGTDVTVVESQEVDLVEAVLASRKKYQEGLEKLQAYYTAKGYPTKAAWAAYELKGAREIKQFRYLLDAEIPANDLRATDSIPEADAMYEEGLAMMRNGGRSVPVFYREKTMVAAAEQFRRLIELYPNSDKIDDAAFQLGEIHKEYLPNQELLAAKWYERCWQWDPQTPYPARYQAATVYDYRLHDRDRALELYHKVLDEEADVSTINRRFAVRRIEALTRDPRTVPVSTN